MLKIYREDEEGAQAQAAPEAPPPPERDPLLELRVGLIRTMLSRRGLAAPAQQIPELLRYKHNTRMSAAFRTAVEHLLRDAIMAAAEPVERLPANGVQSYNRALRVVEGTLDRDGLVEPGERLQRLTAYFAASSRNAILRRALSALIADAAEELARRQEEDAASQ